MSEPGRHDHHHDIAACTLAWQTLRLAHDRVARQLGSALARECALAINEFDVLLYLRCHDRDEVRIGALHDAVALSQPALSRLVARLETRGLLTRSGTEQDGRAMLLGLTVSGAALLDRAVVVHAQTVHATLTGRFSETERASLLHTLSQIGR